MRGAGLSLHLFAASGEVAELFAVYLYRREHGRQLHYISREFGQQRRYLRFGDGLAAPREDIPRDVEGVRFLAEPEPRSVALSLVGQDIAALCSLSDEHGQYSRRHRVECAAVTDAFGMQYASQLRHHVEGSPVPGLHNGDYPA